MRRKSVPVKKYFKKLSLGPFQGRKRSYLKRISFDGMHTVTARSKWVSPWKARRSRRKFYM